MKPFNLEEALAGKPVQTRIGEPVKIGAYNPDAIKPHRVVGWIEDNVSSWYEDGSYVNDDEHIRDLFMVPETKDVWMVLWMIEGLDSPMTATYNSECDAVENEKSLIQRGVQTFGIHKITIQL